MKIIKPSFEIEISPHTFTGVDALKFIEKVARTCYKSEEHTTEDSAEKLVRKLVTSGHEAMLEHINITVKIICDRGVSHELVRHRIASFAQESTRYCNYSKDKFDNELTFIKPCFWDEYSRSYRLWKTTCKELEEIYINLITDKKATPQEARSILPNSLKTEVVMTANLREWRHFFKLRTSPAAHPQMREITIPMLAEFQRLFPIIFEDVGINEKSKKP